MNINKAFKELMPRLTADEFSQLEQNIIAEGCRESLITWNGTLIDGHNRYEICTKHGIPYTATEMHFDNEEDVIEWIIKNQLGRRNLTSEQRTYLLGLRYRKEKKPHGGTGANQYSEQSRQNDDSAKTVEKVAKEHGVGTKTVERAEKFADGLDNISTRYPELKDEILSGKSEWTKQEIQSLAKAEPEQVQEAVEQKQKPHVAHNSGNNEWYTPAELIESARKVMGEIELDPASSEMANQIVKAKTIYTIDDDGLSQEWFGKVWLNPPYAGDLIGKFIDKLNESNVEQAIVLVNNATETNWFNSLIVNASAVVFPKGRVKFYTPNNTTGAPLQGQAIVYIGENNFEFMQEFSQYGWGAVL